MDTLIIGASLSGLAAAACLQQQGLGYIIIEKEDRIAAPWHNHYERLHLHTSKKYSHLPFLKFPAGVGRYPGRREVLTYLDEYRHSFGIAPRFGVRALSVIRDGQYWVTETTAGEIRSKYLIMATGAFGKPRPVHFTGVDDFPGPVLHSSDYKTGADFKGRRVLVVGFGNSACEIAIDLYEQGALPSMAVRSAVNVVPRDVLGIPIQTLSLLLNRLPPPVADAISAPLVRGLIGDIKRLGLRKMPYGPLEQIRRDGRAPVLDIGTIRHIRQGHITIHGDVARIEGSRVVFEGGQSAEFDAIVAATGYDPGDLSILQVNPVRVEDLRFSTARQACFGEDELYFCGYWISPTGQIREIGLDAQRIARDIAGKEGCR